MDYVVHFYGILGFGNWKFMCSYSYFGEFSGSFFSDILLYFNRNFDKMFVYVFVSNTKEVPGVRKVFICFEISKIF